MDTKKLYGTVGIALVMTAMASVAVTTVEAQRPNLLYYDRYMSVWYIGGRNRIIEVDLTRSGWYVGLYNAYILADRLIPILNRFGGKKWYVNIPGYNPYDSLDNMPYSTYRSRVAREIAVHCWAMDIVIGFNQYWITRLP